MRKWIIAIASIVIFPMMVACGTTSINHNSEPIDTGFKCGVNMTTGGLGCGPDLGNGMFLDMTGKSGIGMGF